MPVTLPFTLGASAAAPATARGPVTLPLSFGGGATGASLLGSPDRQVQVLRAVAAAAAVKRPADAIATAKEAVDSPASLFANLPDQALLRPVLIAVVPLLTDRTGAPTADDDVKAAAEAIGADPALSMAAFNAMTDEAATASVRWVALVDATLLDRAARAAQRRHQLALVTPAAESGRIEQIAARLDALEKRVAALEPRESRNP